ncbi:heterokaryon incompatibility protein-domain-containing protein [Stachybotrys elegans]|uniref:Heterokaryon incompatibility protein-domain-containing protein n=1 Tax=Stachybotrys elegans TaxID=80388 RepID=A0A8K0SN95_9HYPO|nr:heterokaryon incompatibility protein-domain-containing protein [Stachybotrys elegans]
MQAPQHAPGSATPDDAIVEAAGEWLITLCGGNDFETESQVLTGLERRKFDEFFAYHGQSPVFKRYHVEAARKCLSERIKPDYPLVRALLEKDATKRMFINENDILQVAIKAARIDPVLLGQSPREACPGLMDIVILLMDHGASIDCLDNDGYSPLFYTCVLGYEELFRFLIHSGAGISTTHKRMLPVQLIRARETSGSLQDERVNLFQVTLDALISPQRIVESRAAWAPGVRLDHFMWELDLRATWGGIVLYFLQQGFMCSRDDPGIIMLLHIACYEGSLEFVKELLDLGVATDVGGPRIVDGGLSEGMTFGTAMHAAAAGRHMSVVTTLISHGVSASSRRLCIRNWRGNINREATPLEVAIDAARHTTDGDPFLEQFITQAKDLGDSDLKTALKYFVEMNSFDFAKHLLQRGIRLLEVPAGIKSIEMTKLLVSHGIELDPAALQQKALRGRRIDLLRWCVNEYGPMLPQDPGWWGEMASRLILPDPVDVEDIKYLVTEYPGLHIDTVLTAPLIYPALVAVDDQPIETSWLHLAICRGNFKAMHLLLENGADPTCPGLPFEAPFAIRDSAYGRPQPVTKWVEIIQMVERKLSGDEWLMPSYAEIMSRVAQTVAQQKQDWDKRQQQMLENRQGVPHVAHEFDALKSPLVFKSTSAAAVYRPLAGSSSLRLVQLQPSSSRTAPLVGCLIDSDITFKPDYEALSYVWGELAPAMDIILDGEEVPITPNLYSALIHLRSEREVRTLWVDALCISQSNHGERNQQVRIMGDIYKSARQVVVWLGEAADDSHLVFEHVEEARIRDSFGNLPKPRESTRNAWNAIMKRPWFYRTWVIQEIALSRMAIIMCGNDSAMWMDFEDGKPDFCEGCRGFSTVLGSRIDHPYHPTAGFDAGEHVLGLELLKFGGDPMRILGYSRVCQTTEVKDRIYGLLGLFPPGFIVVDYDLPVQDIFRHFTEAVLRSTNDLRILNHLGVGRNIEGLPSWVPDFTEMSTLSFPEFYWVPAYREEAVENYEIHTADGTQFNFPRRDLTRKYLPGLDFDGGRLVIMGKMVDTVRSIGPELMNGTTHIPGTEAFSRVMGEWESLATTLIPEWKPSHGNSVTWAFASTLVARHDSKFYGIDIGFAQWYALLGTGILESSDPSMSLRNYRFFLWWLSQGETAWEDIDDVTDDVTDDITDSITHSITDNINVELHGFAEIMESVSYGRCFFTSEKGTMGLAGPRAQAGDCIVYFPGADEPFILRRRDDQGWTIVSNCYVYGLDLDELFLDSEHLVEDFIVY